MPIKQLKNENERELIIERRLHSKRYSLTLDKTLCVGCEICQPVCPREAIEIKSLPKGWPIIETEVKAEQSIVDIDEQKCSYCGVCDAICPYGAITVRTEDEHILAVLKTESFPQLIREIEVNTEKCDVSCAELEDACPLDLIEVTVRNPEGKEPKSNKTNPTVTIDIKKERCPCCRVCEMKFPEGAIRVVKCFQGLNTINQEKCPEGCQDCFDVCPITDGRMDGYGPLYISEVDKKVHVNELFCVYCGACKNVCPVDEALELQRTHVRHTPVSSGRWNEALENLTSTKEKVKELESKGLRKAKESLEKKREAIKVSKLWWED